MYLYKVLGIENAKNIKNKHLLRTINFKEVSRWAVDSLGKMSKFEENFSGIFKFVRLKELIHSYQYGLYGRERTYCITKKQFTRKIHSQNN